MGSCASRSYAEDFARAITAKVVDFDGSMAQFAAPVTAHEALLSSSRFLCCSDELRFDSPARAMATHEALQPGQLYFALPLHMLGRPLSGQDMAALAVKAAAALSAGYVGAAAGTKQRQRRRQTGRVAPLVVVSGDALKAAVYGGQTVGKTRNAGGGYIGGARRLSAGQKRLSVIVEGRSE